MTIKFPLFVLAGLATLALLLAPADASACSCMAFPDDPDEAAAFALAMADVVFLGTAGGSKTKISVVPRRRTAFVIEAKWKGPERDGITVESNIGEIACGYKFEKNRRYLVFSYWDESDEFVTTSFCDLTGTESESSDLIAALDRVAPRK